MDTQAPRKQRAITSARVDPNKPASVVINRFGGLTRFCELTGFATSTAHGWTVSGYIPPRRGKTLYHARILEVAERKGIALEPADFVEKPPQARRRRRRRGARHQDSSAPTPPADGSAAAAFAPQGDGSPPPAAVALNSEAVASGQ